MYSLLIIDDERIVRAGIRTIIKDQETKFDTVYECADGLEALKFLESTRPDLIITDIKMPKMDGLLFIEKCMALYAENPPKIIVLSGYKDFEYARKAMHYGVKDYLLKPLRRKDFLTTIISYEKALSQDSTLAKTPAIIDSDSIYQLYRRMPSTQIQYAAIRIQIKAYREEPDKINLFKQAIQSSFASSKFVLLCAEDSSSFTLVGNLKEKIERFQQYLKREHIEKYFIGYSDGEQTPDTYMEGIAKAKQALKIASLSPGSTFFIYKQGGDYTDNGKLIAAMQYIHNHFDEDIGMAQVANYVSLNYNYFSSMFKSQLGVNFITFITQLRIEKAKFLLKNEGYKISEIAEIVGYPNPKRFSKAFYRTCGISPLDYRKTLNDHV